MRVCGGRVGDGILVALLRTLGWMAFWYGDVLWLRIVGVVLPALGPGATLEIALGTVGARRGVVR